MAKYKKLWNEHLPEIFYLLDKSYHSNSENNIQLQEEIFRATGNRISSRYTFNLEISKGHVINNISGTIVARDLFDVLSKDSHLKNWLKEKKIKIGLTNTFKLKLLAK